MSIFVPMYMLCVCVRAYVYMSTFLLMFMSTFIPKSMLVWTEPLCICPCPLLCQFLSLCSCWCLYPHFCQVSMLSLVKIGIRCHVLRLRNEISVFNWPFTWLGPIDQFSWSSKWQSPPLSGKKAWARTPPLPSKGNPSPCVPFSNETIMSASPGENTSVMVRLARSVHTYK